MLTYFRIIQSSILILLEFFHPTQEIEIKFSYLILFLLFLFSYFLLFIYFNLTKFYFLHISSSSSIDFLSLFLLTNWT